MQFSTEYAVKGLDQAMVDDEELPSDYKPPTKMNSRDLIDGTDLPKYGPSAPFKLEVSKDFNDLSIQAWKLAKKKFESLDDLDKKSTSPNSIAIEIYNQLVRQHGKAATVSTEESKPMSISQSVRRSTPAASYTAPLDLSSVFKIPGLSLEPSEPSISIDMHYFAPDAQKVRHKYKVDHAIFMSHPDTGEPEFFVTVTDQRRGEDVIDQLPVISAVPFDDATISLDLVDGGNQYRITADQGSIEFSFGVFFFMIFFTKQVVEINNG